MWYLCVHPVIEAPTLFCVTNGCTADATGDFQDQQNVQQSEEAKELPFLNKKSIKRFVLISAHQLDLALQIT
ncbi:hypothetical protein CSKR_201166 [Clonorchis sinensis]|uniref:Uncharacterized protein n=1 Tax=Clonorchis sinensis TaxID=79923 RepID=A0A8T1MN71_CLOSI|nr:hypothetical protein CSKR_201166 [Clonorchis sinensis]